MMDYRTVIGQQLNCTIPEIPLTSTLVRFSDDSGKGKTCWAIGHEVISNDKTISIISYGDWRQSSEKFVWCSHNKDTLTKKENLELKRKQKEASEKVALEKKERQDECRDKSREMLVNSQVVDSHAYLELKQIPANISKWIRKDGNTLLIPMSDHNGFNSVQLIYRDMITNNFKKIFPSGSKVTGSFFNFGNIKDNHIFLAEGFSTAATIFLATKQTTICCFNSGNIGPVINSIRKLNPKCKITICADDDHELAIRRPDIGNAGIKAAKLASEKFSNVNFIKPEFENPQDQSDFNDLFCAEGLSNLKKIINQITDNTSRNFTQIDCLGQADNTFYYFNYKTKVLTPLTPDKHRENYFLAMAPPDYWGNEFRFKFDKDGLETDQPDYKNVTAELFARQRDVGFFKPESMRGIGAWLDNGQTVYNTGAKLIIDNQVQSICDNFETKFFYQAKQEIIIKKRESYKDGQLLIENLKKLRFKNKSEHILVAAWIAQSSIFGFLDWRFHIWLTGNKGTGKSKILSFINSMTNSLNLLDSSAAGIRQELDSDAYSICYDETEAHDHKIKDVISIARQCSSNNSAKSLRGTIHGKALARNTSAVFAMASIQTAIELDADKSRFFQIELETTEGQSTKEYSNICDTFADLAENKNELRDYLIYNVKNIKESIKLIKEFLVDKEKLTKRQADQYATALGLYYHIRNKEIINPSKISELFGLLDIKEEKEEIQDESENCLNAILQIPIDKSEDFSVGSAIQTILFSEKITQIEALQKGLNNLGIHFEKKTKEIHICKSMILKNKLVKFSEFSNYIPLLKRSKNCLYKDDTTKRFFWGQRVRTTVIQWVN